MLFICIRFFSFNERYGLAAKSDLEVRTADLITGCYCGSCCVSALVTVRLLINVFLHYLAEEIASRVLAKSSCSKLLFSAHITKHRTILTGHSHPALFSLQSQGI